MYYSILDNYLKTNLDKYLKWSYRTISNKPRQLSTISVAILGNFETTMIKKQSLIILVNYKDNYDKTTTTANKSMVFDVSAIQSCF